MPVADFPGQRNWGYDGVAWYAPSRAYGRPDDLRRLVDAAHATGSACSSTSSTTTSDRTATTGGLQRGLLHRPPQDAVGRRDQLRRPEQPVRARVRAPERVALDARVPHRRPAARRHPRHRRRQPDAPARRARRRVRARPRRGRSCSSPRIDATTCDTSARRDEGGYGLDAVWADDFHHELRVFLTGERESYYANYAGSTEEIAQTRSTAGSSTRVRPPQDRRAARHAA